MDSTKLKRFFELFDKDRVIEKTKKGTTLLFARAGMEDVKRIEKLSDKKLLDEAVSNAYTIDVLGCFSIADLQFDSLYGMEIESRCLEEQFKERWEKCRKINYHSKNTKSDKRKDTLA